MGEVYRARDGRLGRDVAIKVLPEEKDSSLERGARFEREARLLASVNHPNIATIHGLEDHAGSSAIVMELVGGPSLADLIAQGPLGVSESARIAGQIADGLCCAHARGMIHRDLKPSNVKIATDGRVKILDLGLAKMVTADAANVAEIAETRTAARLEGVVVGTPAYMSPEQAVGAPVDQRTDVWAFAAVLFEMLSGRRAFPGRTVTEILAAVLQGAVDWPALPADVPREIRCLLERCFERESATRLSDLSEARALLQSLGTVHSTELPQATARAAFDSKPASGDASSGTHRSLLVLPFSNLSPDADNEYFSDGLTEEVIADLSKLEAMRVISRSTALRFKGAARDAGAAARALDVRYVLDGSVRKAGSNVRVTVQLVDTAADAPLWAEKYSGTLDDVFEIQERISRAIADALRVRLSLEEERFLGARSATSGFAFDAYLRARRDILNFDRSGLDRARILVERALSIAPGEVLLLRAQAMIEWQEVNAGFSSDAAHLDRAEALGRRILASDSTGPHGPTILGYVAVQRGDVREWVRQFRRAVDANPNDPDSLVWLAIGWMFTGQVHRARPLLDRLERIDPLFDYLHFGRGVQQMYEGELEAAIARFRKCIELAPEMIGWYTRTVQAAASAGDLECASRTMATVPTQISDHPLAGLGNAFVAALRGDHEAVERILGPDLLEHMWGDLQYTHFIAQIRCVLGNLDEALRWLERSTERGFIHYPYLSKVDPLLANLRSDARFVRLMESVRRRWATFEASVL
jgi:serine/threonine protein kinase